MKLLIWGCILILSCGAKMDQVNDDYLSVSYSRNKVNISNISKENIYYIGLTNNELARTSWRPMKIGKPILPVGKKISGEIFDKSNFDFYIIYYWFETDSANEAKVVDMKDVKTMKINFVK